MRCLVACCFALSLLFAAGGCHSCERVETELRARENDVLALREEVDRCGVYNQALQQEVHALRGQLGVPPDGHPPAAYPVQTLVLGRQTGGRSNDICPGDDALQVQVEPRDPEGQAIKAPGQLLIQAQEITKEGIKRPLSSWVIPPEELRRRWKNGLLTTGYVLNLPWKVWPNTEKLRVSAHLQLLDGRVFEADRDVTVRLTPINQRPTIVPKGSSPVVPAPQPGGGPMLLPPPRIIDPAKPNPPAPADAIPAPFPTAVQPTPSLPEKDELPLESPAAEMLRPVPLKPDSGPLPKLATDEHR
ncbi:MAG TPA: hypothetical protein VMG10_31625 [Gemmataceae bacterium]|nr:hypothetical protein [Gemmataceae bacterium]